MTCARDRYGEPRMVKGNAVTWIRRKLGIAPVAQPEVDAETERLLNSVESRLAYLQERVTIMQRR